MGRAVVAAAATTALVAACTRADEGGVRSPEPPPPVVLQIGERRPASESFLVRTASCGDFVSTMRARTLRDIDRFGFGAGGGAGYAAAEAGSNGAPATAPARTTAPQAGRDFSATNVQEAGIDEPDTVKTDGRLLVTTTDGRFRVLDVSDGAPRLVASLDLPDGTGPLFLVGGRALVFGGPSYRRDPALRKGDWGPTPTVATRESTSVTIVDLSAPERPAVVRTIPLEGDYVDARLVDGVARVVLRSSPRLRFDHANSKDEMARTINGASADAWLPEGTACGDAYLTPEPAGYETITVRSVDPTAGEAGPGVSVTGSAQQVYASPSRLFVATGAVESAAERTAIHAFDIGKPDKAQYVGSGDVPGSLLNQFSMSEHDGMLRVATTRHGSATTESRVTVLRLAGKEWVETGAVDGLGRTERIYAVRFIGSIGYVVTFRQVDPLYVLDLRDPRKPVVTGELKITGYSAYLHPAGDGRLLGLGQEATDQGRRTGTQLSLFDVADPAQPKKLAGVVVPGGNSEAEHDHHAFLHWPATGLVVVPMTAHSDERFAGAVAFTATGTTVKETGRIHHGGGVIQRSLVVADRLLTISSSGVQAHDLKTLQPSGSASF